MMNPLAAIKDKFENKAKLVEALEAFTKNEDLWVGRLNEGKGLAHVSNAKLLKLHATFTAVKDKFGTRAKLIEAIADVEKRTKDEGYKARLTAYPVPRLWDLFNSVSKRSAAAAKAKEPKVRTERKPLEVAKKKAAPAAPKKTTAQKAHAAKKSKK
ncbi:MAG: hypothetical protein JWP97_1061 [Labilithrix sp.]|nr:hypothetical protein [Labilithrix sp.]